MTFFTSVWKDWCNHYFSNDAHCYFYQNRVDDIIRVTLCVFKEEFIWRAIPLLISTVLIMMAKSKWAKIVVFIVCIIGVLCVQLQFGAVHFCNSVDTDRIEPMIIHGVAGIIFMVTYILVFCLAKIMSKWKHTKSLKLKIKTLMNAHVLGYCSAMVVHATSNVLVVLSETF